MLTGSLCTGIMGLDRAAEAVYGSELAWYSEVEPAACTVIGRHTAAPNLGDLTVIDWRTVPPVDVLTAGYPCQPFSHAGNRKGASDDRHLWPYIADAVRVLRPRRVVLENVAGHLSLGFDVVLGDLAAAGFDAEWCLLRASDVGAPHQRARVFVVASDADARGWDRGRESRPAAEGRRWQGRVGGVERAGEAPADPGGERHGGGQDAGAVGRVDRGDAGEARQRERPWEVAGDRSGEAAADAHGLDDHGCGHVGPGGWAEPTNGRQAATDATGAERRGTQQQGMGEAVGRATESGERVGEGATCRGATEWGQYAPAIRRWESTLGRLAPRPTDDVGRLSPSFVEWLMGYPAGWVDGLSRTQALKALGNAVVPQQGEAALRLLEDAA